MSLTRVSRLQTTMWLMAVIKEKQRTWKSKRKVRTRIRWSLMCGLCRNCMWTDWTMSQSRSLRCPFV